MSWLENLKDDLVITTGDGNKFAPNWINASKTREYNIAEFDFPNVAGTLVKRSQPRGRKYNLEIYFEGDDHLEKADEFDNSANDNRPWVISHPYWGRITVHPISLSYDTVKYNVTKITGVVIETITDDNPKAVVDITNQIVTTVETVITTSAFSFTIDVEPDVDDINKLTENNELFFNAGNQIASNTLDFEDYFNLFNKANAEILNATAQPLAAINALQAVIQAPSLFAQGVKLRMNVFVEQTTKLSQGVINIITPSGKKIYENNATTALTCMTLASANPIDGDYTRRSQVIAIIDQISTAYDNFLIDLDTLQTDNGGDLDSYIPDSQSLIALNDNINFAIANLFTIALDARQERTIILEADSDPINLTHRFYGLNPDDSKIKEFININNIGLDELLLIEKGRPIIYFI